MSLLRFIEHSNDIEALQDALLTYLVSKFKSLLKFYGNQNRSDSLDLDSNISKSFQVSRNYYHRKYY